MLHHDSVLMKVIHKDLLGYLEQDKIKVMD
nr:MAG TPA: hypothetical protein [Caudoviricetes sp.]